jgi:hypothetical protein
MKTTTTLFLHNPSGEVVAHTDSPVAMDMQLRHAAKGSFVTVETKEIIVNRAFLQRRFPEYF